MRLEFDRRRRLLRPNATGPDGEAAAVSKRPIVLAILILLVGFTGAFAVLGRCS